jgi:hypothetical protein
MQNAYGSELLDLPFPFEAQYWTVAYCATNTWDSCAVLPMSSLVMSNFTGSLLPCITLITLTGNQTLSGGEFSGGLNLTKPSAGCSGSVGLAFNVSNTPPGNTSLSSTSSAATEANLPWFGPILAVAPCSAFIAPR